MAQLTDEQYWKLADSVYDDKTLNINEIKKMSESELNDIESIKVGDGTKWVTINSINHESGLQAMAVISLDEYKALCSGKIKAPENMVFVTRGSEMGEDGYNDWVKTNGIVLGSSSVSPEELKKAEIEQVNAQNQFIQYDAFVRQTIQAYNPQNYSFTGHSLGGALAQYMAVIMDAKATTFAAARAYRLLPPELQKAVRDGKYDDMIRDYRHKNDPVGYVPGGEIIGSRYMTKSAKSDLWFAGHLGGSFDGMFNEDGSIMVRISPEEILAQLPLFDSAIQNLSVTQEIIDVSTNELDKEIKTIHRHYEDKLGIGGFSHVTVTDMDDIFEEFAQSHSGDNYYFYDRKLKDELLEDLEVHKRKIAEQRDIIGEGAMMFDMKDQELASKLSSLFGG
ncbi:lipase family protein [Carnobacterium maltaromaticum]|uniref:lipase family protein n=1 Tax=Carnobacterium maltaromaticum TaxID=2751 RepID=UPI001C566F20